MKHKLIEGSLNDTERVIETILRNRGIDDPDSYMRINHTSRLSYLDLDNIQDAVELFKKHIENGNHIHIIVDSDVDGYTSAAMMYMTAESMMKGFEGGKLTYSIHTAKQHGISSDVIIPDGCNLLIVPDAGSNDIEQCVALHEKGIDILILDHHVCDRHMPEDVAVVVNNQSSSGYKNKDFCGAGIVEKFLEALDDSIWSDYATRYVDLCALGNISDVMDMRSPETKYYTMYGINHITSPFFEALIDKQSFSMGPQVTITGMQFYITPLINAMIRVGKEEEKDMLFRAFIEHDDGPYMYKKRGAEEAVEETLYERVARLCSNAKTRQGRDVDKSIELIKDYISSHDTASHKVLFVNCTGLVNSTMTGLVAIKLAEEYGKPCVMLRCCDDGKFGGSMRNFKNSAIASFKDFLTSTGCFEYVQGHDNAAGVMICGENVSNAIIRSDELLENESMDKVYVVDFELDASGGLSDGDDTIIYDIDNMTPMFGTGIEEPLVYIGNLKIDLSKTSAMGKNGDTWKYVDDTGISILKFRCAEDDPVISSINNEDVDAWDDDWGSEESVVINAVCKFSVNRYKGVITPQIIIEEYEVVA